MTEYKIGQELNVEVKQFTPLGVKVLIKDDVFGLIFSSDIYTKLEKGQKITAYVKNIREDGKIDLTLKPQGYKNFIQSVEQNILDKLKLSGGFLPYNDKSDTLQIRSFFGISKKQFKQGIGKLYKNKTINITERGIKLL